MDMRRSLAGLLLALCAAAFLAGSAGMSLGLEPMRTWYYQFAWWPYVLGLESWLFLRGGYSLLWDAPRRFAALLPLSVLLWCVFEAANFRLGNWHYVGLPRDAALRWLGYALGYATVLPALFVTAGMFRFLGLFDATDPDTPQARLEAHIKKPRHWPLGPMALAGALMLALPMAWPRFFFPLVWGGFVLLLEPVLYRSGRPSLLRDLERGRPGALYALLLAGLACGLLWECWNFWAGAKWYYTVPFVGRPRIFEMPLLGFAGFPPFAVSCRVMAEAAALGWDRLGALPGGRVWRALAALAALAFVLAVFAGIDRYAVTALAV